MNASPVVKEYVFVQKQQRWLIGGLSLISLLSSSALLVLIWYGYLRPPGAKTTVTAPASAPAVNTVSANAHEPDLQFSDQIIQGEADRLLLQAGKDVTVLGNTCYGQGNFCPLWHYRNSANLRLQALDRLEGR